MSDNAVEQVRERTDIVDVIGQHVNLRKAGRNFKGLCPFHQEKTPSFVVFPDSQHFHCFGCGAGGDAFSFLMQLERVEFREALQTLASRAGVTLEEAPAGPSPEQVERHSRLFELNSRAATFFSHVLWNTPNGEPGRRLLEQRGVDRPTAERFQLGFAPDRWDALLTLMVKRGATADELIEVGLASRRDDGGAYDRFRNRLIFPIRDREGRIVGFGGRILGAGQPKYLNTAQTAIFDKSANLYALDVAQDAIRRLRTVVVVEGYMDAIAAHQFGFDNVVASMGTALTEQQVRLIRRGVDKIILALDADAAGQMATVRGLNVMRESLGEAGRPIVNAAGMVRFARELKTTITIVRLPSGKDPDELIRADPDAWRGAIADPVPLLDFYVGAVIGDPPPTDPQEKSRRVEEVVPVLREIGDSVVTGHYIAEIARRLGIDDRDIREAMAAPPKRAARVQWRAKETRAVPVAKPEEHLFAMLVTYTDTMARLLDQFPEQDILDARNLELLRRMRAAPPGQMAAALAEIPDELRGYVDSLQARLADRPVAYPGQIQIEAEQAIRRLRKSRYDERQRQLLADLLEARQAGDVEAQAYHQELLRQLMQQYPELYPERSPYFLDARDAGR